LSFSGTVLTIRGWTWELCYERECNHILPLKKFPVKTGIHFVAHYIHLTEETIAYHHRLRQSSRSGIIGQVSGVTGQSVPDHQYL